MLEKQSPYGETNQVRGMEEEHRNLQATHPIIYLHFLLPHRKLLFRGKVFFL